MVIKSYKIAVIPGDGIGNEVVPEAVRVLDAVANNISERKIVAIIKNLSIELIFFITIYFF